MISFTSTTSARITNSDDKTTELVAARPTPHSLKTGDQTDDQSEHHGLKGGRQKVAEIRSLEAAIDELMERQRLGHGLGNPPHDQARKVGSKRKQGQHQDAS